MGVIQVFCCAKCVHFHSFVSYIRAVGEGKPMLAEVLYKISPVGRAVQKNSVHISGNIWDARLITVHKCNTKTRISVLRRALHYIERKQPKLLEFQKFHAVYEVPSRDPELESRVHSVRTVRGSAFAAETSNIYVKLTFITVSQGINNKKKSRALRFICSFRSTIPDLIIICI